MQHLLDASRFLVVLIISSRVLLAQPAGNLAGHWEGVIQVPGQEMKIVIDLVGAGEKWEGTIAIPIQNVKAYPLSAITVRGDSVSFAMSIPGNPQFKGTFSKDGQSLSGEFTQGGGKAPFTLARTGDAQIAPAPKSTPVTRDFEGTWEGLLEVGGQTSRFVLTLANRANGSAAGTLVTHRTGREGTDIPIAAVVQTGSHLKLDASAMGASYEGDLEDNELRGTWTRGATTTPLVFKRRK